MFEVLIREAGARFGLGAKALELVQMLLAYMTDKEKGGLAGFLEPFKTPELGPIIQSWLGGGPSARPISNVQLEQVLGGAGGVIPALASRIDASQENVTAALGYLLPALVGKLTPGGNLPHAIPAEIHAMAAAGRELLAQVPARSAATGSAGAWMKWLPWLIIAILIIAALAYWGRNMAGGSGQPAAGSSVTQPASSAGAQNSAVASSGNQTSTDRKTTDAQKQPVVTSGSADPTGSAVIVHDVGGQPMLNVYFATASAEIPADFSSASAPFVEYLKEHLPMQAVVSGYSDATGSTELNAALSKKRAMAVQSALIDAGLDATRVLLEKPAESTGVAPTDAESRRVVVMIRDAS